MWFYNWLIVLTVVSTVVAIIERTEVMLIISCREIKIVELGVNMIAASAAGTTVDADSYDLDGASSLPGH